MLARRGVPYPQIAPVRDPKALILFFFYKISSVISFPSHRKSPSFFFHLQRFIHWFPSAPTIFFHRQRRLAHHSLNRERRDIWNRFRFVTLTPETPFVRFAPTTPIPSIEAMPTATTTATTASDSSMAVITTTITTSATPEMSTITLLGSKTSFLVTRKAAVEEKAVFG